jgi:cytochrome oxidase Cu insertion factor (SCO1/SenC/PrrC family)
MNNTGGLTMNRVVAVIFSISIFLLWNVPVVKGQTQFAEAGVEKFRVPVEAPEFTLQEIGGGKVSLKELRGKIILLNFFATW